jgi:hypothetical protein
MSKSKKRKKPVIFAAKRRKDLVADLGKKDYADIVEIAITRMESELHLDLFPPRKKFVTVVCSEKVNPVLTQFIMENVSQYIETYRRCMRGKKYLMFEQRWFSHIEQYFTEPAPETSKSPSGLWNNVVERAKLSGADLPVTDQRIIVSTLAYHIHDLMVDRVKAYKETVHVDASTEISHGDIDTETTKFYESRTSLL